MKDEYQLLIEKIKKMGLTAYEISKHTSLTEVGINKILNGQSKPRRERFRHAKGKASVKAVFQSPN